MNSPKHVAIIMDGNGRWGIKKKNQEIMGIPEVLLLSKILLVQQLKKKLNILHFILSQLRIGKDQKRKLILY